MNDDNGNVMTNRIELKLDRIIDKLNEHSIILAQHSGTLAQHGLIHQQNAEQLEQHIARTNALEEHMDLEHKEMRKDLETALLPIKSIKWLVPTIIALAATVAALKSLRML